MLVYHLYEDGTRLEQSMGCFGSCGRSDSYCVNPKYRDEWYKFNQDNELVGSGSHQNDHTRSVYKKPVKYIALNKGFDKLFHERNRQIMEYFLERSPYRICFDQPYDEVFKQNEVRVLAVGVPSEVTMSALFYLRSIAGIDTMNETFTTLRRYGSEWMAFVTTKMFPYLSTGSIDSTYCDGGDAVFFHPHISRDIVNSDDPFSRMVLFNRSVQELQGYTMNIRKMWYGSSDNRLTKRDVDSVVSKHSRVTHIQGIFGTFSVQGCTDFKQFLTDLWG